MREFESSGTQSSRRDTLAFDEQPGHLAETCAQRPRGHAQQQRPAQDLGIRVVNPRIGLVLGADGGILQRLALAAKLGGAAVIGDGRQWMSWIHVDDMVRVLERALDDDTWSGPVNAVAPEPVRQREFQRALTRALRRPLLLRIPAFLLRASLGEMAELLVKGQRVASHRLRTAGFEFSHGTLDGALRDLITHRYGEES